MVVFWNAGAQKSRSSFNSHWNKQGGFHRLWWLQNTALHKDEKQELFVSKGKRLISYPWRLTSKSSELHRMSVPGVQHTSALAGVFKKTMPFCPCFFLSGIYNILVRDSVNYLHKTHLQNQRTWIHNDWTLFNEVLNSKKLAVKLGGKMQKLISTHGFFVLLISLQQRFSKMLREQSLLSYLRFAMQCSRTS